MSYSKHQIMNKAEENQIKFHAIIEKEVNDLQYGMLTVNVLLKDGQPMLNTINIVRQKRKKYKLS